MNCNIKKYNQTNIHVDVPQENLEEILNLNIPFVTNRPQNHETHAFSPNDSPLRFLTWIHPATGVEAEQGERNNSM